jgi:hypothetical protein
VPAPASQHAGAGEPALDGAGQSVYPVVVVARDRAEIIYDCGCQVRCYPSFREAYVCSSHSHLKIEADMIRYC